MLSARTNPYRRTSLEGSTCDAFSPLYPIIMSSRDKKLKLEALAEYKRAREGGGRTYKVRIPTMRLTYRSLWMLGGGRCGSVR